MSNMALRAFATPISTFEPSGQQYQQLLALTEDCLRVESMDQLQQVFDRMHRVLSFEAVVVAGLSVTPEQGLQVAEVTGQGSRRHPVPVCADPCELNASPLLDSLRAEKPFPQLDTQAYVLDACGHPSVLFAYVPGAQVARQRLSLVCLTGAEVTDLLAQRVLIRYLLPHLDQAIHRLAERHRCCDLTAELSGREQEVLNWIAQGKSSWEVSQILQISEHTVKFHLANIYRKLNVVNRTQAVSKAASLQLIRSR